MDDFSLETSIERKKRSSLLTFTIRLAKEKPMGVAAAVVTLLLLFTAIFADHLAPYGMNETWVGEFLEPPSAKFLFGTDNLGRDILSRVIYGARVSVIIGLSTSVLATIVSLVIGIVSGYVGGRLDLLVQRAVDTTMCIPTLILLMVFISIIGPGIWQVIIVIGLTWGVIGSRIIRSAVIDVKDNVYIQASKSIGCSTLRIFARHILPNIMAPTIILFTVRMPGVIMTEASLSFLGFGIPPPTPSWGGMLSGSGRRYMFQAPWMVLWPGLALSLMVYAVNMFGDAVRDLLDPKLKGGVGRYGVKPKKRTTKEVH
ncbi:MAG: ABC transporter permease [Syntrophaceae bacterium]|nr:ABC transporter permease [Syntrophaceae bacterium]